MSSIDATMRSELHREVLEASARHLELELERKNRELMLRRELARQVEELGRNLELAPARVSLGVRRLRAAAGWEETDGCEALDGERVQPG